MSAKSRQRIEWLQNFLRETIAVQNLGGWDITDVKEKALLAISEVNEPRDFPTEHPRMTFKGTEVLPAHKEHLMSHETKFVVWIELTDSIEDYAALPINPDIDLKKLIL